MKKRITMLFSAAIMFIGFLFPLPACHQAADPSVATVINDAYTESDETNQEDLASASREMSAGGDGGLPRLPSASFFPPMLFINNEQYEIFTRIDDYIPVIDDLWEYIGLIESVVERTEKPSENLQANTPIMGAAVYYSSSSSILFNVFDRDIVRDEVWVGNSVIVDNQGERLQYITPSLLDEIRSFKEDSSEYGILLQIDGATYIMRLCVAGGKLELDDGYILLGEVSSSVPETQRPTENMQVNNTYDHMIGANVYRIPPGFSIAGHDLVLVTDNTMLLYYSLYYNHA